MQCMSLRASSRTEVKTPLAIMKGEIEQTERHLELAQTLSSDEAREVLHSLMEEVERWEKEHASRPANGSTAPGRKHLPLV